MRQAIVVAVLVATSLVAQTPGKRPYSPNDWAAQRTAGPVAVSPNGQSILYRVGYGATSGPENHESWTIHPDGSGAAKLTLPNGFTPGGFTPSGTALYGTYRVNNQPQFAVFPLTGNQAAPVPTTVVVLPRGIQGILPSPDGTRFALLAAPRLPAPLASPRPLVEPDQTSLYVVNLDGTAGHWACPTLHEIAGGEGSSTPPFAWSPDSTKLAILSSVPKIGHHDVRSSIDICPAAANASPTRIADIPNSASSIAWATPTEIAFLSTQSAVLTPEHLYTVSAGGGAFGAVLDRMNHVWHEFPEMREILKTPPRDYVKKFVFDTVTFSDPYLRYLIEILGPASLMAGSDGPTPIGQRGLGNFVTIACRGDADAARQILAATAARFFGLDIQASRSPAKPLEGIS